MEILSDYKIKKYDFGNKKSYRYKKHHTDCDYSLQPACKGY